MGYSRLLSAQVVGVKTFCVEVETDVFPGTHSFSIVGLAHRSVEEARDRVMSCLSNSQFKSPQQKQVKVVVSLSPSHLKKEGAYFDLAIAIGYLHATQQIKTIPKETLFVGGLSLDGRLLPVPGILGIVQMAKEANISNIIIPFENYPESQLCDNIRIVPLRTLKDVVSYIDGECVLEYPQEEKPEASIDSTLFDSIEGQEEAKRALLIAAAGGHPLALFGPPGTGKTMLAKAFTSLLPSLSKSEAIETTFIHSLLHQNVHPIYRPPFRSPHHSSSHVAIVGGGAHLRPGEITLAHNGVLFLDEFPEFDRRVIESLREPLEEGIITISRAKGTEHFPARTQLILAMNPCPCGFYGTHKVCTCSAHSLERYRKKLSGPIVDRIDMWVEVALLPHAKLLNHSIKKTSPFHAIRKKIETVRSIQYRRSSMLNAQLSAHAIKHTICLSDEVKSTLETAATKLELSARSLHKCIKLAQTLADIDDSSQIQVPHILEALQYRPKHHVSM